VAADQHCQTLRYAQSMAGSEEVWPA